MKKIHIFTAVVSLIVSVGLVLPVAVFAQYNYGTPYVPTYGACIKLTGNLFIGSSDVTTGGQVSALQSFLISRGYLPIVAPTGFFGTLTVQAVARFQFDHGLPSDGVVGASTRSSIQSISCGNNFFGAPTSNFNNNCFDNYSGYNNCFINSPISISNVSGPTNLTIGARGFWSLTLNNPNSNFVSVSARWGDEGAFNFFGSAQQSTQFSSARGQQTISFNHTYQSSGFYTIVFTATDNTGAQTSVSTTVSVSGGSVSPVRPTLSSISPSSARIGAQVVLNGFGFSSSGNTVHFGNGGSANVPAFNNGTMIFFTIPNFVNPCNLVNSFGFSSCSVPSQQIFPGNTYPVFVTNAQGQQTGTIFFNVAF